MHKCNMEATYSLLAATLLLGKLSSSSSASLCLSRLPTSNLCLSSHLVDGGGTWMVEFFVGVGARAVEMSKSGTKVSSTVLYWGRRAVQGSGAWYCWDMPPSMTHAALKISAPSKSTWALPPFVFQRLPVALCQQQSQQQSGQEGESARAVASGTRVLCIPASKSTTNSTKTCRHVHLSLYEASICGSSLA